MFRLWDKLLKLKRTVSLVLLFFIVMGIVLPNTALGFSIDPKSFICEESYIPLGEADLGEVTLDGDIVTIKLKSLTAEKAKNSIGITCVRFYLSYAFGGIGSLFSTVGQFIAVSAGTLLNYTAGELIKDP